MTVFSSATPWAGIEPTSMEAAPRIGVLESNGAVGARIARVLSCATDLGPVAVASDPTELRAALSPDAGVIACDASELDLVLDWATHRYPGARVITWTTGAPARLLSAAVEHPGIVSILGWPSFLSMPRPWELSLSARRLSSDGSPRLSELTAVGATTLKWRPRTTADLEHVVGEVQRFAGVAGANGRLAERLAQVAHELLMNAMYDAPRDAAGHPRYAYDRRQSLTLDEHEIPVFRMACDGMQIALQCTDPFGALRRGTVFAGIERGLSAGSVGREPHEVLDTSGGGAGLGLFRIYAASTVMIVDVSPGTQTSVTSLVSLDVNPREARTMPVSLHVFGG